MKKNWTMFMTVVVMMVVMVFTTIGCNDNGGSGGSPERLVEECIPLTEDTMIEILDYLNETPPFTSGILIDEDLIMGYTIFIEFTEGGELVGEVCHQRLTYGSPLLDQILPPYIPVK